jgi:putative SOS response-associated peptidase YedK
MSARYSLTVTPAVARALFGYDDEPDFPPRAAISPTEPIGIVAEHHGRRRFLLVRWGFIPGWVKNPDEFPLLFNARAETAAEKPAFRNAFRRRRCLVPADSFYEWQRRGSGRGAQNVPWRVRRADGLPLAIGGLWETWIGADGSEVDTAAILTTPANGTLAALHDRMPLVIEPADFDTWLDTTERDLPAAERLARPAADGVLVIEPVDPQAARPLPRGTLNRVVRERREDEPEPEPEQGNLF